MLTLLASDEPVAVDDVYDTTTDHVPAAENADRFTSIAPHCVVVASLNGDPFTVTVVAPAFVNVAVQYPSEEYILGIYARTSMVLSY